MRKIHKLLLPIIIFMSATIQVKAQKKISFPMEDMKSGEMGDNPLAGV